MCQEQFYHGSECGSVDTHSYRTQAAVARGKKEKSSTSRSKFVVRVPCVCHRQSLGYLW